MLRFQLRVSTLRRISTLEADKACATISVERHFSIYYSNQNFTKEPISHILYSLYFLKIIFINNTTAFFSHSQARICVYDFHDEKVKVFPFPNYLVMYICPRFLNDRSLDAIPSAKGVQVNLFKCRSIQKSSSTQAF